MNFGFKHLKLVISAGLLISNVTFSKDVNRKREYKTGLSIDNDALAYNALTSNGKDRHLTNQIDINFKVIEKYKKGEHFDPIFKNIDSRMMSLGLSQLIYTPEDLSSKYLIANDRPYAGWLHASGIIAVKKGNSLFLYGVDLGIVGPDSYSEQLQKGWHSLIKDINPAGWHNQLRNELGVNLNAKYAKSFRREGLIDSELITHIGGSAGNVDTHAELGAMLRVGLNVPDDIGMGIGGDDEKISFYGVMKINQKAVLRDIFLDGNTFSKSHSVEKNTFVTTGTVGVTARYKNFELGFYYDLISKQFKEQKGVDNQGTIFFNFNKKF